MLLLEGILQTELCNWLAYTVSDILIYSLYLGS